MTYAIKIEKIEGEFDFILVAAESSERALNIANSLKPRESKVVAVEPFNREWFVGEFGTVATLSII